jgi:hypothetical protein
MGPIEAAATPANGQAIPAARAASAKCVTLDELVNVAASIPCAKRPPQLFRRSLWHDVPIGVHHIHDRARRTQGIRNHIPRNGSPRQQNSLPG